MDSALSRKRAASSLNFAMDDRISSAFVASRRGDEAARTIAPIVVAIGSEVE
jgi:hypothetical protein